LFVIVVFLSESRSDIDFYIDKQKLLYFYIACFRLPYFAIIAQSAVYGDDLMR